MRGAGRQRRARVRPLGLSGAGLLVAPHLTADLEHTCVSRDPIRTWAQHRRTARAYGGGARRGCAPGVRAGVGVCASGPDLEAVLARRHRQVLRQGLVQDAGQRLGAVDVDVDKATSHEVSSNAGRRIAAIHPLSCEPRGRPEAMRAPRPGGAAAGSDGAATARAVRGARPRLLRRPVPERDCRAARRAAAHSQGPYLRGLRRLPALWRRTITADSGPSALVRRPAGADVAPMESLVLLPVAPAVGLRPPVLLRLATFADVDAVAAMHRRCSAASRYRRYLMATSEVSPASVRRLLADTVTTVAEALDGRLVAMGNVCLDGLEAEAALLVEDDWQRRGLGVCLACVLAGQAVESGAEVLTATVMATNIAIRRTLAAAGLAPVIADCDAGTLELHCDLLRWSQPQRPARGPSVITDRPEHCFRHTPTCQCPLAVTTLPATGSAPAPYVGAQRAGRGRPSGVLSSGGGDRRRFEPRSR